MRERQAAALPVAAARGCTPGIERERAGMMRDEGKEGRGMSRGYEDLGVRPVINAAGTLTRLGGLPLPEAVARAMAEAATVCVPMEELQEAAGRVIADATGAEAGFVTSGAAAGLTLAAAACLAGMDVARMDRLPDTTGMPNEI